jgi:hypothetical protein
LGSPRNQFGGVPEHAESINAKANKRVGWWVSMSISMTVAFDMEMTGCPQPLFAAVFRHGMRRAAACMARRAGLFAE